MKFRVPMFGMVSERTPLSGLLEHYGQIEKGMVLIRESMECYITGGTCRDFETLHGEVNDVEDKADKIKRNIRNHLPRGLFMPVDRTVFIHYTRSQDNILDSGQESLNWLSMRRVEIPAEFQKELVIYLDEVEQTVTLLKPALAATVEFLQGSSALSREGVKDTYRAVRYQHKSVRKGQHKLVSDLYNSSMEFKDIYQLIHFVECLDDMSHNAENCADMLRTMIAR